MLSRAAVAIGMCTLNVLGMPTVHRRTDPSLSRVVPLKAIVPYIEINFAAAEIIAVAIGMCTRRLAPAAQHRQLVASPDEGGCRSLARLPKRSTMLRLSADNRFSTGYQTTTGYQPWIPGHLPALPRGYAEWLIDALLSHHT